MVYSSAKKNAALNVIKTIASIVFPIITFPYVSRVLSVESIGAFNFSASIVNYGLLFAGLGVSNYSIREGAQYRENTEEMKNFTTEVFSINMISTIIVYLALLLLMLFQPKIRVYFWSILIMSAQIISTTIGVGWMCNIYEDFTFIAIRTIMFQFFSLIATLVLVKTADDYYTYVIITAIALSGAHIVNFFYVRKKYIGFTFSLSKSLIKHIKPILVIFASTVTITIYVNSDVIILGFLAGDYEVGLYSTAVKIYTIIKNLLVALLAVLVPRFSILFMREERKRAENLFNITSHTIVVFLIPVVVGLFLTSNDVICLIASGKYSSAGGALRLLSISILFSIFAYLCTNCVLLPNKKELIILYASLLSAVVNVVFNFILIPVIGINAAALTTIMAEAIMCVICLIYSKKCLTFRLIDRDNGSVVFSCIGIIIACRLLGNIHNMLLRLFLQVVVSGFLYLFLLLISKNNIAVTYCRKIFYKVKCLR